MSLTPDELRCIPLLHSLSDENLVQLSGVFTKIEVPQGELLFEVGRPATEAYLLAKGEITIYEGDKVRMKLRPPACVGELGVLAAMTRNTTAKISEAAEIWKVSRADLMGFFQDNAAEIGLPFYQTLVDILGHKVRRDQIRLADMRTNLIRTQKAMKEMRNLVLDGQDTPFSEELHNTLDALIRLNRRVNYRVEPPSPLQASVRMDDKSEVPVVQISRTHISFSLDDQPLPGSGSHWTGVLCLAGPELPISGTVLRRVGLRVDVELDLLIEEYSLILDGYLTRVQMVDFMV